jgi:hypothetical protein
MVREATTKSSENKENQEIMELNSVKKKNKRKKITISQLLEIPQKELRKPKLTMIQAAM